MTGALDPKTVVRRCFEALEESDMREVHEAFAEDATWTLAAGALPMSGTWEGRDGIMDWFFATAMANYEPGSVELEIIGLIGEQDQVVLQWTSRARTRDGRPYENGCIGVFTVRDGKIQAVREYMDTLYAGQAFGGVGATAGGA
jgi:uncharacterized protein